MRPRRVRSKLPGRAQAAHDGAGEERVEALPQPRARGILGRGHAHMVPAVVLDEEVPIGALRKRHPAQPSLHARPLVPELVRGVDRDPAHHPHRQRQPEAIDGREFPAEPQPAREHQARVLDRDEQVRAPAVVAILFQPLDHAVRGVPRIPTDQQIEQREDPEDQERPVEPEDAQAGDLDQAVGEKGQRRHDQAEQPRVALGVPPARRGRGRGLRAGRSGRLRACPHAIPAGWAIPRRGVTLVQRRRNSWHWFVSFLVEQAKPVRIVYRTHRICPAR